MRVTKGITNMDDYWGSTKEIDHQAQACLGRNTVRLHVDGLRKWVLLKEVSFPAPHPSPPSPSPAVFLTFFSTAKFFGTDNKFFGTDKAAHKVCP